jgi:hypothetical protein
MVKQMGFYRILVWLVNCQLAGPGLYWPSLQRVWLAKRLWKGDCCCATLRQVAIALRNVADVGAKRHFTGRSQQTRSAGTELET